MGVYGEQILPRIVDVACNVKAAAPQRRRACAGLAGDVVEIGFGSGLNVPFYTIPDVAAALRELRRVLKPGAALHFVEHGLAPDVSVRRWQHRLEPIQKRLFGGCHLTRPVVDLLSGAGFTITELDVYYEQGSPKFLGANSLGVAQSP